MNDYAAMVSEVADLARRIGPAWMTEDIRDRLDDIVNRHRRRAESDAARTPGPARRYAGYLRCGQILHLYESAEDMRAAMMAEPRDWSASCWLEDVVFHGAGRGVARPDVTRLLAAAQGGES